MTSALPAAEAIPFSHKRHAGLKVECTWCHTGAAAAERAGFPDAGKCQVCHVPLKKPEALLALSKDARPFPSTRVYKLPDFVIFSHARHHAAKIECRACHGDVPNSESGARDVKMNMKACIDCHKAARATIVCNACHELGQ